MGQRRWNLLVQPIHPHSLIYSSVPVEAVVYRFVHTLLVRALSPVVHVVMPLVAGSVGKALLANAADHSPVLGVHLHVALQVCNHTEGLTTVRAAVTPHLGVYLQSHGVRERLETQRAVEQVFRVGLFMVQEGASVAVGASTQVTPATVHI